MDWVQKDRRTLALALFAAGIGLLVLVFAWTVWPTPYRYHRFRQTVVRIDRLTGAAEALYRNGWQRLDGSR